MKKLFSTLMGISLLAGVLSACANTPVTSEPASAAITSEAPATDEVPATAEASAATESPMAGGPPAGGMMGGGIDKSSDAELQALISEVAGKFQVFEYTDVETGKTLPYNLYIPADYDPSQSYPLVLFIADSSVVGRDITAPLTQGHGALVWAAEEEQAKHASFVLVPEFPEVIVDDHNGYVTTDYVEITARLLDSLMASYSIDENRVYGTGQSMGCMTVLYLSVTHPDLFAATVFVDGQWDINILQPLEGQKFFYFAAGGDQKASTGMSEVKSMFGNDGLAYSEITLNAKDASDSISAAVQGMIAQGNSANFVSWETGSVLPDGVSAQGANEHMYSFDHAYQVSAVRDWLFGQTK